MFNPEYQKKHLSDLLAPAPLAIAGRFGGGFGL